MEQDIAEILKKAMELPLEARAAIAGSLLDSLDRTVDEDAESMWEKEILLRLQEIDQGKVELVLWAEARSRIKEAVI